MFEDMTFENILQRMLNRVSNDVDKREGSIIYDALVPIAYEQADFYFQLDNYINLLLGDTAVGEYLDRKAAELGVERKAAVASVRKVTTSGEIPVGSVWGIEDVTYTIDAMTAENEYSATCNTPGIIGNRYSGKLTIVSGTSSETATLGDVITEGTDEEDDESLRARYYNRARLPATSGNEYHYKLWAEEVPGVGKAHPISLMEGPGTVGVLIVNQENRAASEELIEDVSEYIATQRPIGATVIVKAAEEVTVNVSAKVKLQSGVNLGAVQNAVKEALTDYFSTSAFVASYLSIAKLGSIILAASGVDDCSEIKINEKEEGISTEETEIMVAGTVSFEVMT